MTDETCKHFWKVDNDTWHICGHLDDTGLRPLLESMAQEVRDLKAKLAAEQKRPTMPEYEQKMLTEVQAQTRFLETIARAASSLRSSR